MGKPAVLIEQKGGKPTHPNHKHQLTTERFANRQDITFQKCSVCGDKFYPPGFFRVYGGSHTVIAWPT